MGVSDRIASVTEAGSMDGIGFATAKVVKVAGARVAITSILIQDRIHLHELNRALWTIKEFQDRICRAKV